jgi:hypothetical protein
MAKLDGEGNVGWEHPEKIVEQSQISGQIRGKLPQDHTETIAEPQNALMESGQSLFTVAETMLMGDEPTPLESEDEARRSAISPGSDRALRREPIEAVVDLYRRVPLDVVVKPS